MAIIRIIPNALSISWAAAWLRDSPTRESVRSFVMGKREVNEPPACRPAHSSPSFRTTTRSEIVRLERGSQPLQIRGQFGQPWQFSCLLHPHRCSSWAKSSEPERHFFFSAISRTVWLRPLLPARAINSPVLPDSATQPCARASLPPTLSKPSRLHGL